MSNPSAISECIEGQTLSSPDSLVMDESPTVLLTAAKGGMLGLAGSLCGKGLTFVLQVMVSRMYGPQYYGLFVTAILTCYILQILSSFGLQKGGMRFLSIAHEQRNRDKMTEVFLIATFIPVLSGGLLAGLIYGCPFLLSAIGIGDSDVLDAIRRMSIALPFFSLLRITADLSRAFKTTKYAVIIEDLLFSSLQILFFIGLHWLGYGFQSIIYSFILSALVCAVSMSAIVWHQIGPMIPENRDAETVTNRIVRYFQSNDWKPVLKYALPLMPLGLLFYIDNFMDIIMLNILNGVAAAGEYAAAARWTILFSTIMHPINQIFGPLLASHHGNHTGQVPLLFKTASRWMFFSALPIFVFMMLAREPAMEIFGKAFAISGPTVLAILMLGSLFTAMTGDSGNFLALTGHQYHELLCMFGSLLLNIILNLFWIPKFGVYGAAAATTVSNMIADSVRIRIVHRYFGMHPFGAQLFLPILVAFMVCSCSLLWGPLLEKSRLLTLAAASAGGGMVVASILMAGLNSHDRELIHRLKIRIVGNKMPGD